MPPGQMVRDGAARRGGALRSSTRCSAPPPTTAHASSARRRSPSRICMRPTYQKHGVRPSIVLPGRPLADPAGADGAAPGDARLRAGPRRLPADLGRGRGRLRDRAPCARRRAAGGRRHDALSSWPARRHSATTRSCGSCCARRSAAARCCTSRRRSSHAGCVCWRRRWDSARSRPGTRPS